MQKVLVRCRRFWFDAEGLRLRLRLPSAEPSALPRPPKADQRHWTRPLQECLARAMVTGRLPATVASGKHPSSRGHGLPVRPGPGLPVKKKSVFFPGPEVYRSGPAEVAPGNSFTGPGKKVFSFTMQKAGNP